MFNTLFLILIYLSYIIELIYFSVPSTANTRVLINLPIQQNISKGLLFKVSQLKFWQKIFLLILPHFLLIVYFLIPIYYLIIKMKNSFNTIYNIYYYLAFTFIIVGRVISVYSGYYLKANFNRNTLLLKNNIFKYSRNPILIGMYIFIFGLCLLFNTYILWIGYLYYLVYMHLRVLLEEEYLRHIFHKEYEEYFKITPRYLFI